MKNGRAARCSAPLNSEPVPFDKRTMLWYNNSDKIVCGSPERSVCAPQKKQVTQTMIQTAELDRLNQMTATDPTAMQRANEAFLETAKSIAAYIQKNATTRPIILLSGPSGSGKTTTAYLIERCLDDWDMETHTLSMDHFFRTMTPQQRDLAAQGKLDLESPERLNIPYLNQQLHGIIAGKPTWMPKYHFSTTTREDHDWLLTRKPRELLILEGIHALNPSVIRIPDAFTIRIFISVQTCVTAHGTTLLPEHLRLIRRMIRDRNYRSRDFAETLKMFEHVQEGERNYITPYEERAMFSVDTFVPYELGVYRRVLGSEFQSVRSHPLMQPLSAMWDEIVPLSPENVPKDSLVREFLGGSVFCY